MNIEDIYFKRYETIIVKIDESRSCSISIPVYNNKDLPNEFILQNSVLKDLEIINLLNELEKKDRQLEERTNRIRNLEKECQKYFDSMMETIQENNNKNFIIVEMAKEINSRTLTKEEWCPLLNDSTCTYDSTCLKCLIEYFKRKVENDI